MTPQKKSAIECAHVSVRRGTTMVLQDLTFRVQRGEQVALLGPNGCGKSTLLKLMTRELYPTDGTMHLFDELNWDVFELRARLGIVSNDFQALFRREMTGYDMVVSGFLTSIGTWPGDDITQTMRKKALAALKRLEVLHLADTDLLHVSTGEARRLMIARSLVTEPEFLVFDEPSNSLDLAAQQKFRHTLSRLAKEKVGIFLATHHLSDIVPEINRIIMLKQGRIIADGPKKDLLTKKNLSHLFDQPLDVIEKNGLTYVF